MSISTQIRQLIIDIKDNTGYVDGLVQELTFAKRLSEQFLWEKCGGRGAYAISGSMAVGTVYSLALSASRPSMPGGGRHSLSITQSMRHTL